uniref:Protein kinase domain-containing protein n=1 Tax=Setaria digitata TaxID=48799 RepID=A0A915PJ75_9BILA
MSLSTSSSSIPKPTFEKDEIINNSWKIIKELGSGGCGIVYEVEGIRGTNTGTRAAMKAETVDTERNYSETLAAEALVLRRMQWSSHFCRLYLAGRWSPSCNVIVMSLVGRPLSWLRRQNPSQRFTLSTALRLGIQCLEAIEDLHSIGMIHRDVKGSNFAIGQKNLCRMVHMIDFGFARFYLRKGPDGKLYHRYPRRKAPYLGTDRYCSVFVHMRKEQGRRDDLWSFLYMLIEFIVGALPWRSSGHRNLLSLKLQSEEELLKNCPHEFYTIFDHIRYLNYSGRPNYLLITRKLREICERKHYMADDPYDWEEGGRFHEEYLRSVQKAEQNKKQKNEKKHRINENNGKFGIIETGKREPGGKQEIDEIKPEYSFTHESLWCV